MVRIPLVLRLKKARHKEIAGAQDIVIEELYKIFSRAILHGGTSIWRCYEGNRFSEDIDVYIQRDFKKINILFNNFKKRGFIIEKKKISENGLFSNLKLNGIVVRLEALFKKQKGILKEYETVEGNLVSVYSLTPEEIIKEKVNAYLKRGKIRDLYDTFFLLRYVKYKKQIEKDLRKLIAKFKMPVDRGELKVLIFEGLIPDIKKMLISIKREI